MARVYVAQSRPHDWAYLSEGGSTVVFSYRGPFHPAFAGKVLRLRKTSNLALNNVNAVEEEDDPVITFQNTVIAHLVPQEFLPKLEAVFLDAEWLEALEALRDGDRPAERRAKDRIDKTRRKGMLATDLIGGADILAVEVKPKWGFMPNPAHLSPETTEAKTSTCRFCIQTHFNSKGGNAATEYCPLDLYSGDEVRMRKAIHDLWNGWMHSDGKLNNMRIFVSGQMIKPSKSYSALQEFLSTKTEVREALATAMLPLLHTPALKIISDLQRSLDALDIEGVAKLHAMAYPNAKGLGTMKQDPSMGEWQDFAASYESVYGALDHCKPDPNRIDMYLTAYLLSATFKDCSLILRIRRSERSMHPDGMFIIDLDLKGVDRFERWARVDREMANYYRSSSSIT